MALDADQQVSGASNAAAELARRESHGRQLGRRQFGVLLGGAALALWSVGCAEDAVPPSDPVVRIAVVLNEDDQAEFGGPMLACQTACREINDAGGLLLGGQRYLVDAYVAVTRSEFGVEALQQLVVDGTFLAVGPPNSYQALGPDGDGVGGQVLAARDLRIVAVSPAATSPAIGQLDSNGFQARVIPSDELQARVAVDHLVKDLGAKRLALLYGDEPYGRNLSAAVAAGFEAAGGTVIARVPYDWSGTVIPDLEGYDFANELKTVFADRPDALYLVSSAELAQIGKSILLQGHHDGYGAALPAYVASDSARTLALLSGGPPEFVARLSGTSPAPDSSTVGYQRFAAAMAAKGNSVIVNFEPYFFDAVYVLALALQRAQRLEPDAVKAALREVTAKSSAAARVTVGEWATAREALLAGKTVDFDGASGPIELKPNGDSGTALYALWKLRQKSGGGYEYDLTELRTAQAG